MLAGYLMAAIPRPTILLGQELYPFCLGHLMLLTRHECAFVEKGAAPAVEDLVLGVYICAHTYEEGPRAILQLTPELLTEWRQQLGEFSFDEQGRRFIAHIQEGSGSPRLVDEPTDEMEGVRTPGTAFLQQLKLFLMRDLHMSRSDALNMPLGEALHDYYGFYELKGACKVYGPDDQEFEERSAEIRAEILAEMGIEEAGRRARSDAPHLEGGSYGAV